MQILFQGFIYFAFELYRRAFQQIAAIINIVDIFILRCAM